MKEISEKVEIERTLPPSNALYRESTIALIRRIVENEDREALGVLINTRKLFCLKSQKLLLLPDFLLILRDNLARQNGHTNNMCDLADCCYDLTLAKYFNFPNQPNKKSKSKSNKYSSFMTNIDCRNYYRTFLQKIQQLINRGKIKTKLQAETFAGNILQNLVYRNFLRSKMDCLRHSPFSVRYAWNVNDFVVYLWYPSHMTARKFKQWLEENVKDFDPKNPKEKERIQGLINRDLQWGYPISLEVGDNFNHLDDTMADQQSLIESKEALLVVDKLANDVAQEKVSNVHHLRPSIKIIGAKNIKTMILRIFSDLSQGDFKAVGIAELYGISKATVSRFAGNTWFKQKKDKKVLQIPDLWQNTAGVLAGNPEYMEIVLTSGVGGRLEEILEFIDSLKEKPNVE